mmetsp:Transcript_29352/g.47096  ORF Transcript_29352/g.47096 Transcript_29352/m.47096 type:complete len:306 (+) Transcript_29352:59-976(+)
MDLDLYDTSLWGALPFSNTAVDDEWSALNQGLGDRFPLEPLQGVDFDTADMGSTVNELSQMDLLVNAPSGLLPIDTDWAFPASPTACGLESFGSNEHPSGAISPTSEKKSSVSFCTQTRSLFNGDEKKKIRKRKLQLDVKHEVLSAAPIKRAKCAATKSKSCEFCTSSFETAEELQTHRQKHVTADSKFCCIAPNCKKQYQTGEGLRLHVRNVHLMAKNWKCLAEGCKRSFVRQSDLRMHIIRIHSDIRPFPCPAEECQKSFACNSELRRHVNSCHKGKVCPELCAASVVKVDPKFISDLMKKTA